MSGPAFILRALRYRNYRLYFFGQMVSFTGTWMTNVATSWLAYRLTGSATLLGILAFASQFPGFVISPWAGIYVDRWNQFRTIITTQILLMIVSLSLAAMTLAGWISVPALIFLNVVQSFVIAFDIPCRQAFVVSIIDKKEDLGNAIALNSIMFNVARLVGPAVGGIIIAASGEGWCFFIDGISFLGVIFSMLAMSVRPAPARAKKEVPVMKQMREGWDYASGFLPIRAILILVATVSMLGFPFTVLMPVFAKDILGGGPHTLGFLMGAFGGGALFGGLWLASRKTVLGLDRAICLATGLFGVGVIAFGFSKVLWLSLLLSALTGCMLIVQWAASNTILQTIVDDDKRGRVTSFFMMSFLGTTPIGALLMGKAADRIGAPHAVSLGGLLCILGTLWFAKNLPDIAKAAHPVYARMGIVLPPLPLE